MKKLAVLSMMAISLGLLVPANAQMNGGMMCDSMQRSGMHKNMMRKGQMGNMREKGMQQNKFEMMHEDGINSLSVEKQLMPSIILIKKLPGMQQQLNLTDDQVSKLIDLQAVYAKQKIDFKVDLTKKELKLKNLLQNNASSKEISDQLTACASVRISIAVSAYETANKMRSLLNDLQKKKLNNRIERFHSEMHGSDE